METAAAAMKALTDEDPVPPNLIDAAKQLIAAAKREAEIAADANVLTHKIIGEAEILIAASSLTPVNTRPRLALQTKFVTAEEIAAANPEVYFMYPPHAGIHHRDEVCIDVTTLSSSVNHAPNPEALVKYARPSSGDVVEISVSNLIKHAAEIWPDTNYYGKVRLQLQTMPLFELVEDRPGIHVFAGECNGIFIIISNDIDHHKNILASQMGSITLRTDIKPRYFASTTAAGQHFSKMQRELLAKLIVIERRENVYTVTRPAEVDIISVLNSALHAGE